MTAHTEIAVSASIEEDGGHLIFHRGKRVAHDHHAEHAQSAKHYLFIEDALMGREMDRL